VRWTTSDSGRIVSIGAMTLAVFAIWMATASSASPGVAFFFAVPVGLATWWFGRRVGAGVGAVCGCLYAAGALMEPVPAFAAALALRLLAFAAVVAVVSLLRERLIVLEHSAQELEAIRAALTPSMLPEIPDVDAAAAFVPSEYGVSGDFYLLTNGPDGSTVAIVGDVAGHGPAASRLATFIRARFAAFASGTSDPSELLTMANAALIDRPGREAELVSAVCLRFDASDSRLCWAVAGHPPPLRLREHDEIPREGFTFLLGADPRLTLRNLESPLEHGDGVVIYTDGATDVRREGTPLGLDGLSRLIAPIADLPARDIAGRIEEAILNWADGPIRDDLCVLVLKPKVPAP
jgi:serine phosphatase RsbU (regulator of sigma subunit)